MADIVYDENFTPPGKKDFKNFRQGCLDDEGWTEAYKGDNLVVLTKNMEKSSIRACKVRTVYKDVKPESLYDVLHDHEYRKTWDENMIDGYVIEMINDTAEVGYYSAKMPTGVSNRDFCNLRTWQARIKKGEYTIFNYSVKHKDCPEKKGFVRANSILTGYYIRKVEEGTEFNYYSQSDPKGWIPAFVINFLMTKLAPKLIDKLHTVSLKYDDWKAEHNPDEKPWLK